MAIGQLNGIETGSKLSAHDCFELGRQTYNSGDAANTVKWMNQALKIYDNEDKKSVELVVFLVVYGFQRLIFCKISPNGFSSRKSMNILASLTIPKAT
jgi:hypothetical protein